MIIIEPNIEIADEQDVEVWTGSSVDFFVEAHTHNNIRFIVPEKISKEIIKSAKDVAEENQLLQAYKVGLLKIFLSAVYPEKKYEDIYKIIREDFQVFYSIRKLKSCYTLYKNSKKIFYNCI